MVIALAKYAVHWMHRGGYFGAMEYCIQTVHDMTGLMINKQWLHQQTGFLSAICNCIGWRTASARCTCTFHMLKKQDVFLGCTKWVSHHIVAVRTKLVIHAERKKLRFLFTLNLIFVYHDSWARIIWIAIFYMANWVVEQIIAFFSGIRSEIAIGKKRVTRFFIRKIERNVKKISHYPEPLIVFGSHTTRARTHGTITILFSLVYFVWLLNKCYSCNNMQWLLFTAVRTIVWFCLLFASQPL